MFGLSPLIIALGVTLAAFLVSTWWFGVHRRRRAETAAGIRALAGMKWRECAGLVLQALAEKGFAEMPASRQPGDGGTEFLLSKNDERCLVGYKHGTAYRLGEANVRDFANAVQLLGASSGILVTLGTAEGSARDVARRYGVELMDGDTLWPQVEPFASPDLVEGIRKEAAHEIRRGQRMGVIGSLLLGAAVFGVTALSQTPESVATPPEPGAGATAASSGAAAADATGPAPGEAGFQDPASLAADQAIKALDAVAKLTDGERADRRRAAAARIADLPEATNALWSTASTLVISLVSGESVERGIVTDACTVLVEFEELRYSRLQLEPPSGSEVPVRWRQCQ